MRELGLTVITPWWNHRELERDYWAAIRAARSVQVIIIDNGSEPALPWGWRMGINAGFSKACNTGLELATTDAVVFLNNDVGAHGTGWDDTIRAALAPGVLVGAELRMDAHGAVDGQSFPYLDGWCLAGMREELLELGGWDEEYEEPSYFGDNDLSLRARLAGMTLREVKLPLIHKRNQTAGQTERVRQVTAANYQRFAAKAREIMEVAA